MKPESIQQTNQRRANIRSFKNQTTAISGKLETTYEDGIITITLHDAMFWNPTKQTWFALSKDEDKFQVQDQDKDTAYTEFWFRFKTYLKRRFNRFVELDITYI